VRDASWLQNPLTDCLGPVLATLDDDGALIYEPPKVGNTKIFLLPAQKLEKPAHRGEKHQCPISPGLPTIAHYVLAGALFLLAPGCLPTPILSAICDEKNRSDLMVFPVGRERFHYEGGLGRGIQKCTLEKWVWSRYLHCFHHRHQCNIYVIGYPCFKINTP
jgi:hypothetical protein